MDDETEIKVLKPRIKKKKTTVYLIVKNNLHVSDELGNSYIIPITKEYANTQIGDTVYIQ